MTYQKCVFFVGVGGGLNLLFGKDALNWSNLKTFNMYKKHFFSFVESFFNRKNKKQLLSTKSVYYNDLC